MLIKISLGGEISLIPVSATLFIAKIRIRHGDGTCAGKIAKLYVAFGFAFTASTSSFGRKLKLFEMVSKAGISVAGAFVLAIATAVPESGIQADQCFPLI